MSRGSQQAVVSVSSRDYFKILNLIGLDEVEVYNRSGVTTGLSNAVTKEIRLTLLTIDDTVAVFVVEMVDYDRLVNLVARNGCIALGSTKFRPCDHKARL